MAKYAKLPDGKYVSFPDDWSEEQMDEAVYRDFADQFPDRQPAAPGLLDSAGDAVGDIVSSLTAASAAREDLGTLQTPGMRDMRPPSKVDPMEDIDAISTAQPAGEAWEIAEVMGVKTPTLGEAAAEMPARVVKGLAAVPGNILDFGVSLSEGIRDLMPDPNMDPDSPDRDIWSDIYTAAHLMSQQQTEGFREDVVTPMVEGPEVLKTELPGEKFTAPGDLAKGLLTGSESAGHMVGALLGGRKDAMKIMFGDVAGSEARDLKEVWNNPEVGPLISMFRDAGYSDSGAAAIAALYGGAELVGERVPLDILFKKWGDDWVKDLGKFIIAEAGQEHVTEGLQAGLDKLSKEPDMTWGDFTNRYKDFIASLPAAIGGPITAVKGLEGVAAHIDKQQRQKEWEESITDEMARMALQPKQPGAMAPETTIQQPEQVGPPAAPATARQATDDILAELNTKIETVKAADKLGGKRSGAMALTEDEARDEQMRILDERLKAAEQQKVATETEAAYAEREAGIEALKEEDLLRAREQQISEDSEAIEAYETQGRSFDGRPVLPEAKQKTEFVKEYNKHRGNFDDHIRASIPGFGEVQILTGDAIVNTYGEGTQVLDVGASEGSWIKAITAQSDGNVKTTGIEPLKAMAAFFKQTRVPGSELRMEAWGDKGWTEPDGTKIEPFKPDTKYDVVHEAMVFQFIDNNRTDQIARAKDAMKPDGILLTEEKFKDDGTQEYKVREAEKDEYKSQYFTQEAIQDKKKETLVVGMDDNMVVKEEFEQILMDQFDHVVEYWNASNFGGYVASDSIESLDKFLKNLGDTTSEYSEITEPRWVSEEAKPAMLRRQAGPEPVGPEPAEGELPAFLRPQAVKTEQGLPRMLGSLGLPAMPKATEIKMTFNSRLHIIAAAEEAVLNNVLKANAEYQLPTKAEHTALRAALSDLEAAGMPLGTATQGIRFFVVGNHTVTGRHSAMVQSKGNQAFIALGRDILLSPVRQGAEIHRDSVAFALAHEIMHSVDIRMESADSREKHRGVTEVSPLFMLNDKNSMGPVMRELWGAYFHNRLGMSTLLHYPFSRMQQMHDVALTDAQKYSDLNQHIQVEAFAQLGAVYYTYGGTAEGKEKLRSIMPQAVKFMEQLDNVLKTTYPTLDERDRAVRGAFGVDPTRRIADAAPGGYQQGDQQIVEDGAAGARVREVPGERREREAGKRGRAARNDLLTPGTLYSNPIQAVVDNWHKQADKAIDTWNDAVGWRYGPLGKLPAKDLYLQKRYTLLGKIADVDKIAKDVYSTFRNAIQEDQRAVYDYLTTPDSRPTIVKDAIVRRKAIATKKLINRVGQGLVDRGLLSEEAFMGNKDGYLPRTYLKHLIGDATVRSIMGGKKVSKMGWSKARKNIPKDVRQLILGEITDPAYLASKGIGTELRDIAIIDFLDYVSREKAWVAEESIAQWQGRTVSVMWLDEEARRLEQQAAYYEEGPKARTLEIVAEMQTLLDAVGDVRVDSRNYKEVPMDKRYGRLKGMHVRKEIYDDLINTGQIMPADADFWENWFGYGGTGTKVTQLWKMSKVALNPPAQLRNAASNMILIHLSGIPAIKLPGYLARAAREIATNGRYWRIAKKHGVTESTFAAQELYRIERDLLDLEARMAGKLSTATLKNVAGIVAEKAGGMYQAIEAFGKTAKIMHAMEVENMSAEDAAMEAQKWLFDYSLVPSAVRTARNMPLGTPFITFYYKVMPRLLETAIKRPWAYVPYVAIPQAMAMLFAELNDVDDDDAKALMKTMPQWLQDRGNAFILPVRDEQGRWEAVDFSYILPWSMFVEVFRSAEDGDFADAVKASGVFGGPIPSLATAIKTNTDPFTGREIVSAGADPRDQMMSMLTYMYTMAMPTWLTEMGFAGKMLDAINSDVEMSENIGKTILTPGQATARLFGINIYPFDPERTRGKNIDLMQKDISEIRTDMKRQIKDVMMSGGTDDEIEAITNQAAIRIEKIAEEIATYAEESEIPESLARP